MIDRRVGAHIPVPIARVHEWMRVWSRIHHINSKVSNLIQFTSGLLDLDVPGRPIPDQVPHRTDLSPNQVPCPHFACLLALREFGARQYS